MLKFVNTCFHLFCGKKFTIHRLLGLAFLIQYFYSIYLYFTDYNEFYQSWVLVTLPISGFLQSVVASCTFTFLPKNQKDPGYYR